MDYYDKLRTLNAEKTLDEVQDLYKKIMRINPSSPIHGQILDMIEMAESYYRELLILETSKNLKTEVIEIGTIESKKEEAEISNDALFKMLVDSYKNTE